MYMLVCCESWKCVWLGFSSLLSCFSGLFPCFRLIYFLFLSRFLCFYRIFSTFLLLYKFCFIYFLLYVQKLKEPSRFVF